jgi:hypothetical protein
MHMRIIECNFTRYRGHDVSAAHAFDSVNTRRVREMCCMAGVFVKLCTELLKVFFVDEGGEITIAAWRVCMCGTRHDDKSLPHSTMQNRQSGCDKALVFLPL